MPAGNPTALSLISRFVATAKPPDDARARALAAVIDTIGVAIAGSTEPAAEIVRRTFGPVDRTKEPVDRTNEPVDRTNEPVDRTKEPLDRTLGPLAHGPLDQCRIWAGDHRASPPHAALINGTSAHALDYDDMCFVSLAHPSAPLVPAIVAAGELAGASGRAVLDAYVVGFEVQARLGQLMNPRHYQRGWHCTSTLGAMSAAAGAARVLGLDAATTAHALAIAASSASGLKENFGTMVKPLHAGLAARDGITAALLARSGLTGSDKALDGPQGFLRAFDSERVDLRAAVSDLGSRWEILETGVTVKLYPSCAGTHPTLDALLDLRAEHSFEADSVAAVEIEVDPIVPTILLYDRPATALEGKFSMPFCAAAAIVFGRVGIDTFDDACLRDSRVVAVMSRITMRVDEAIGAGRPALTESRVRVRLTDGRVLTKDAHGARGYPSNPASQAELDAKFLACAGGVVGAESASALLTRLKQLDDGPLVL